MPLREAIAYLLILLLAGGLAATGWRIHYNSERQRMKRYYRSKDERPKR
jgi:hypothetical protein